MDDLTIEQRHKNMQHIRSKDTQIEILLRRALWKEGIRYRKNYDALPGKPDIAITKYRIAIFCDGEFFHGKNWETLQIKLQNSNNSTYWLNKIEKNIQRDLDVEKQIRAKDWIVIRFWGNDIKHNLEACVDVVRETIQERILSEYLEVYEN